MLIVANSSRIQKLQEILGGERGRLLLEMAMVKRRLTFVLFCTAEVLFIDLLQNMIKKFVQMQIGTDCAVFEKKSSKLFLLPSILHNFAIFLLLYLD